MIEEQALVPVLDEVLQVLDQALTEQVSAQTKIAELDHRTAQTERLILEKVAAAKAALFPQSAIEHALDRLVALRLIGPGDRAKVAGDLAAQPARALTLLEKISESLVSSSEGGGIPRLTEPDAEADPDGWLDFAAGRPVEVHK